MTDSDDAAQRHGEAKARAVDVEFTARQFWFLRQVVVDAPECAGVAIALVDHANRKTGLMFPSLATLALCTGKSIRAVQPLLSRLEKRGHITFAGWVRAGGHANVKSWRSSLTDRRVEKRFDLALLGDARSGRNLHDQTLPAAPPVRKDPARPAAARSGRNTSSAHAGSRRLVMQDPSYKPSEEPSDRTAATTASSLLRDQESERKAQEHLKIASEILDLPLDQKRTALWRNGMSKLEAAGLDFMAHVVPAMRDAKERSEETGEPLEIASLNYFRMPATKMRDLLGAAESTVQSQVERDVDRVLALFRIRGNKADRRWAACGLADLAPHGTDTILAALKRHIGCTREGYAENLWHQLRTRPMWRAIEYALPRGTPQ